jgi:tRNA U54 and U55 pseudouridine synthase Pus10
MKCVKSFWISLSGWSRSREVKVMEDGRAYFEISEQGHCGICQGRIRNIQSAVEANKVDVKYDYLYNRYPSDGRTLWIGIVIPKKASDQEIKELFKEKLLLPIY